MHLQNQGLTGIILCGGESRRMGKDKGLLKSDNETWATRAQKKLQSLNIKTAISINISQFEAYLNSCSQSSWVIDMLPIRGPLNGILSAHLNFPDQDLFVLACDLTEMEIDLLKSLYIIYQEKPNFDFYYFELNKRKEPLCAIYKHKALHSVLKKLEKRKLNGSGLQQILKDDLSCIIPCTNERSFLNVNNMEVLKGMDGFKSFDNLNGSDIFKSNDELLD